MDPSYIITQVTKPQDNSNSENINIDIVEEGTSSSNCNENHEAESSKCVENASAPSKDKRQANYRRSSRANGGGSRFLSQLLCCFGFGHSPDYSDVSGSNGQLQERHRQRSRQENQPCHQLDETVHEQILCSKNTTVDAVNDSLNPNLAGCDFAASEFAQSRGCLLPPAEPEVAGRICAVIDLDETLVHSSFRSVGTPDFAILVEVDGTVHQVFVQKRPHVDAFLVRMGELFECVLFTASMGKYADPVSDLIDPGRAFKHRLFRESCVYHCDNYVKDLATLGRPVDRCLIIDNSPASYMFHVENAIKVQSWMGEPDDTELLDLLPYMEQLSKAESVTDYMRNNPPPQGHALTMEQMLAQMECIDE